MTEPLLLDTHILIWLFNKNAPLSPAMLQKIKDASAHGMLSISAISMWEVVMLESRKRISFDVPLKSWWIDALETWRCQLIPLDIDSVIHAYALSDEFHGDPADRMIVGTAKRYDLTLVTADRLIQQYAKTAHLKIACA